MSETDPKSSLNAKIVQLDTLSEWFYGDEFTLDQALTKYQTATKLVEEITHDLDELENQVRVVADFTRE